MWIVCGRRAGLTRQAWYAATRRQEKLGFQAAIVLEEVRRLRKQAAGLGTTKLYEMMQDFLTSHQIKLGRDRLHNLLKSNNGLLLTKETSRESKQLTLIMTWKSTLTGSKNLSQMELVNSG